MDRKETSWGGVADWYKGVVSEEGGYQNDLIKPNLLRMMSVKKGERILDLACGEGFMSRAFKEEGGVVSGADIAPELIGLAKKSSPGIDFHIAPADDLEFMDAASADKVAVVMAIQNIENVSGVFKECARVLKSGGSLYLVINHPCFRVLKNSSWGDDKEAGIQYRRIDKYISEMRVPIDMHPGGRKTELTVSFHRPLQYYFKALSKSGFCVSRLEEWTSMKESQPGRRAAAENRARKEIPLFMALECRRGE